MIKNKQRELIDLLMKSRNFFKTSAELAIDLSLSDRTIRTYIKDLKERLESNGSLIISKQGLGYKLVIIDRIAFNLFLIENHIIDENKEKPRSREVSERKHYLLNLLLLEDKKIDIDDLSESLFISLSQLNKDILEIKKELIPYELIVTKNKSTIFIDGSEKSKRHFIMHYFFHQTTIDFLQQISYSKKFNEIISFDMLTIIILDECREAQLKLSDIMIQNIVLHLSLSIKRLQSNFCIKSLDMPDSFIQQIEYQVAKKIIDRIESLIDLNFPKEEQMYLTLHLISKSNVICERAETELSVSLNALLKKIQDETGYLFFEDEQLKNGLFQHFIPMLIRLKQNITLENPLLDEIKENYPDIFYLTKCYCSQLFDLRRFDMNDDEWGYLTLHFLASVEKQKNEQKKRVLIICATGLGSAQLLKNRVESEFGDKVKIVGTKGYYEINTNIVNQVDFIISSIDLSTKIFKIPVFYVSIFLSEQNVQQIRSYLLQYKYPICINKNLSSIISKSKESENLTHVENMVDDFVNGYFYLCRDKGLIKEEICSYLLDLLAVNEDSDYKKEMIQQINNRTKLSDICFSDMIAVPHPATPVGKLSKIGVAIIPKGLFWDDNHPHVCFVFLISPSIYKNPNLSVMTKAIVALIDSAEMEQEILKTTNFTDFKKLFIKLIKKGS